MVADEETEQMGSAVDEAIAQAAAMLKAANEAVRHKGATNLALVMAHPVRPCD
jgi:hypothetical protein